MRTHRELSLMPNGKPEAKAGMSNLCKKGHDLNEHGVWEDAKRGLCRRCSMCDKVRQAARTAARKAARAKNKD